MLLKQRDHAAFHRMLPKSTLDEAVKWSSDRGYTFSRKAIWNYRRRFEGSSPSIRVAIAGGRAACLLRLNNLASRMDDRWLAAIFTVAELSPSRSSKSLHESRKHGDK